MLRKTEVLDAMPLYKLSIEELFEATEHPLFQAPEEVAVAPEVEYGEEEGDEEDDEDAEYFKPGEKRRRVRPRKQLGEEQNRFSNSSKRARFNLTQQLNPSALSALKGGNILYQALNHTKELQNTN